MSLVSVTESSLENIAAAIRNKKGGTDTYTPNQMAGAINGIKTADEVVLVQKNITANGTYNPEGDSADGYSGVSVDVANSYSASDNGKVVVNQALVAQTSKNINANGTHDTTANNSVVVDVPNSYVAADEGKVVSGGALVGQTSRNVTMNGTYDTTENNEVVVNVPTGGGGGGTAYDAVTENQYALNYNTSGYTSSTKSGGFSFTAIKRIEVSKIRVYPRNTSVNVYISNGNDNIVSIQGAKVVQNQWNDIILQSPVILEEGNDYTVWYSHPSTALRNASKPTPNLWYITNIIGKNSTSENTIPTTNDSYIYAVDIFVSKYWQPREAVIITKSITQNGTYNASDDNADGYSSVTVNVSGGDDSFSLKNYIESSGTQWVDTEYIPTQNSVYELVAEFLSGQPTYSMIIGARSAREGTAGNPVIFGPGSSAFQIGWGTRTLTNGISSTPFLNQKVKYIIDKDGYNGNNELNRPCGYGKYNGEDPLTEYSIYLFSLNSNGSEYGSGTRCKAKLYRFRIYESDTLVHEYIPHIDSNDVVCLKDTQTGNLFYNAGTGVFTYGTDGE